MSSFFSGEIPVLGDYNDILACIGAIAIFYVGLKSAWSCLKGVLIYGGGRFYPVGDYLRKKGSWAVVTGATDGIGKVYARELARYGIDVILISRTESKLRSVAAEIEQEFKVKTKTIVADFSKGYSIYDDIKNKLQGLPVGILVNNVGVGQEYPEYFLDVPNKDKLYADILYVNCASVTQMTAILMPVMVERKRGLIINVSSAAGVINFPLISVYSASKAYIRCLSDCLSMEYGRFGVHVQCVTPYFVCSNMTKVTEETLLIPSAQTFVRSALRTVPFQSSTIGYWSHELLHIGMRMPFDVGRTILMKMLLAIGIEIKEKLKDGKKDN